MSSPSSPDLTPSRPLRRRQKEDKSGRLAALERLKSLKGSKNKYEIKEEAPVYEEVDEKEYSRIVRERQEEDWIVDDDGCGYVEDGREIFDDDLDDLPAPPSGKKTSAKNFAPPNKKNASSSSTSSSANKPKTIKSMFMAPPAKRKLEKDIKIDEDNILGSILQELNSGGSMEQPIAPKPMLLKRKATPAPQQIRMPRTNPFSKKSVLQSPLQSPMERFESPVRMSSESVTKMTKPRTLNYENNEDMDLPSASNINDQDFDIPEEKDTPSEGMANSLDVSDNTELSGLNEMDDMDIDEMCSAVIDSVEEQSEPKIQPVKEEGLKNVEVKKEVDDIVEDVWAGTCVNETSQEVPEVHVISSDLPLTVNSEGERVLSFFWLDAYEDYFKHPGTVYLFGKTWIESAKVYASCCIVVKNIERKIYLLPKVSCVDEECGEEKPVSMKDVYLEFSNEIAEKYKIDEFKSRKVKKCYAFEKTEVPNEAEYLEVRYSASLPCLPLDLKGRTFSHVFGTNTSSLEMLLLECKMKGPGWLDIKNPVSNNPPISWCKIEASVMRPENICIDREKSDSPPPLVIMSLGLKTVFTQSHQNEIIAASCLIHRTFPLNKPAPTPPYETHFCALAKPSNTIFPFDFKDCLNKCPQFKVEKMESERALLSFLLAKIHRIDPDVIVGHDICGFDIDVLLHRFSVNKVPNWSRIGRLKRSGMPRLMNRRVLEKSATSGRLICDIKIMAKELIRSKSYDLTTLVETILHRHRVELNNDELCKMYSSSQQLLRLVNHTMMDGDYVLRIMSDLNVLPLAYQITCIAGNVMSRTLLGGRAERNEFLLLHAFHERNYICPDKVYGKQNQKPVLDELDEEAIDITSKGKKARRKPAYTGGLVLEPKKGFYDKYILLMDFNSLYPSIIQEYNICFTTVPRIPRNEDNKAADEDDDVAVSSITMPDPSSEPGILPNELRKLVESRQQVKQLLKNQNLSSDLALQYDIRQKALKLTANSIYGCLGFTHSRFYAKTLAALVTSKGRETLLQAKELAENMGLEVVYGDTDSIMINTRSSDFDAVMKLGREVKAEVNKMYKLLELDVDGVFKSMLLLKKKKYAALMLNKMPDGSIKVTKEMKGLDIVRRDWSELSKKAGEYVITEILSDKSRENIIDNIQTYLIEITRRVKEGQVPLEDYLITKQLTKQPEDYPDKKNQPHVQVALRMNTKGGKKIRQGDTVSYLICQDGSNQSANQRAYHPEELKKNESLKIDFEYYLAHQIHPVVTRLCEPIEGMDAVMIAELLGLDPSGYKHTVQTQGDDDILLAGKNQFSDEERFAGCDKLKLFCPAEHCSTEIEVAGVFVQKDDGTKQLSIARCPGETCKASFNSQEMIAALCNQIPLIVRPYINRYYKAWLVCEDSACGFRTRRLPLRFTRMGPVCPLCEKACLFPEYNEKQLYNQLCYFRHVVDVDKTLSMDASISLYLKSDLEDYGNLYRSLKESVDRFIRRNAYGRVDLNSLFSDMYVEKPKGKVG